MLFWLELQSEGTFHAEPAARYTTVGTVAVVVPVTGADGAVEDLCLFFTTGADTDAGNVRKALVAKLPPYQVPALIERLDRLPVLEDRKLDRKARRAQLANLRGLRIESAYLVEYLLPKKSVTALHIYFPDPWPKRKHRKNRLINEHFTEIARQALIANGIVYLRTDDQDYFNQMVSVFAANTTFGLTETPDELSAVVTDFERNFHARGVGTLRAAYFKMG